MLQKVALQEAQSVHHIISQARTNFCDNGTSQREVSFALCGRRWDSWYCTLQVFQLGGFQSGSVVALEIFLEVAVDRWCRCRAQLPSFNCHHRSCMLELDELDGTCDCSCLCAASWSDCESVVSFGPKSRLPIWIPSSITAVFVTLSKSEYSFNALRSSKYKTRLTNFGSLRALINSTRLWWNRFESSEFDSWSGPAFQLGSSECFYLESLV